MQIVMGLDVGDKTIGVAVSDALGLTAHGVEVIRRSALDRDFSRLQQLMKEYGVERIVIGLPINMDGSHGPRAKKSQDFAKLAEKRLAVPVSLWDERLTTASAERTLLAADVSRRRRKQVIDKLAASLILQSYLDAQRRKGSHA